MAIDAPGARDSDEPGRRPPHRRVVNSNAIKRLDRRGKIRDARVMDCADLSFGCAVSTCLSALDHACNVLVNRVHCHEMHVCEKSVPLREHRLVNRRGRAKGGFDC
jgi:hypothetical protein